MCKTNLFILNLFYLMIKNWCKDTHILLKSLYLVFGRYYLYCSLFHSAIFYFHAHFIQLMSSAEKPSMPLSRRGRKPNCWIWSIMPVFATPWSFSPSVRRGGRRKDCGRCRLFDSLRWEHPSLIVHTHQAKPDKLHILSVAFPCHCLTLSYS